MYVCVCMDVFVELPRRERDEHRSRCMSTTGDAVETLWRGGLIKGTAAGPKESTYSPTITVEDWCSECAERRDKETAVEEETACARRASVWRKSS